MVYICNGMVHKKHQCPSYYTNLVTVNNHIADCINNFAIFQERRTMMAVHLQLNNALRSVKEDCPMEQ